MFNLSIVSCNIKNARTKLNMTQMNLADAMGVSFQAVSNWERGNSMPDIGKLSDLCNILGITFEELVGEVSKATENVKKVMKDENANLTMDELVEIAPIVNPDQIESVIDHKCEEEDYIDIGTLCGLAAFLSREKLDELAERVDDVDIGALTGLAPFLSPDTLSRLVEKVDEVDVGVLCGLAPFLRKETLDRLVSRVGQVDIGTLTELAPFLSKETLNYICIRS